MADPRVLIAANAAEGAALQRQANARAETGKPIASQLRTGRRTAQAIAALMHLRTDILAGVGPVSLVDRIDDELFKLRKRP